MRSSLMIVGAFIIGCLFGYAEWLPEWLTGGNAAMWVLYALMLQVGDAGREPACGQTCSYR